MYCVGSSPLCDWRQATRAHSIPSSAPSRSSSYRSKSLPRGRSRFKNVEMRNGDRYRPRLPGPGIGRKLWNRGGGDSEKYFVARDEGSEGEDELEEESELENSDEDDDITCDELTNPKPEPKVLARDYLRKLRARRLNVRSRFADTSIAHAEECASKEEYREDARRYPTTKTLRPFRLDDYEKKQTDTRKTKELRTVSRFDTTDDEYFRRDRRERGEKPHQDTQKSKSERLKRGDAFYSTKKLHTLGASQEVIAALSSMGIERPSEIQALSYQEVLRGNSCIIADQTGSGKTLAYLAPLVQRLREDEEKGNFSTPRNPRVLVLAPTSELAMQVLSVCRALSTMCPLKSMVATGGFKWKTQVENLESGPDLAIATPGRFLHHLDEETIQLNKLQSVVLDEVDILFEEEEFVEAMQKVGKLASKDLQYIHVTATLPTDVHDKILNKHPLSVPLLGPSLHLTAPGLKEILVDCSGGDDDAKTPETAFANKKKELLNLLQEDYQKTIIFCNKIETCRKVENILKRYDRSGSKLSVLPYHAALSQEARLQSLQSFLSLRTPELSTFLVCTDRASRGLDSVGVDRVILFDFPRDPSEYIRRVGRTARAGGSGKVFIFVVGKQVTLARKIMDRNEKRHPVHTVPGTLT